MGAANTVSVSDLLGPLQCSERSLCTSKAPSCEDNSPSCVKAPAICTVVDIEICSRRNECEHPDFNLCRTSGEWDMTRPSDFEDVCVEFGEHSQPGGLRRSFAPANRREFRMQQQQTVILETSPILFEDRFVDGGDEVCLVLQHDLRVEALADWSAELERSCSTIHSLLDGQLWDQQRCQEGDAVELRARSASRRDGDVCMTIRCNGDCVLASKVLLSADYRVYRYLCPTEDPVWGITLQVEPCAEAGELSDSNAAEAAEEAAEAEIVERRAVQLDVDFGLRLRGEDLLHSAREEPAEPAEPAEQPEPTPAAAAAHDGWRLRGASKQGAHVPLRHGLLPASPGRSLVAFENAIEFVVHGLSGREQIDVFANGFSVPCQASVQLDNIAQPRLLRYVLAPASASIRSVVIRLRSSRLGRPSQPFGAIIDSDFGVMASGQNCLPTAVFLEPDARGSRPAGKTGSTRQEKEEEPPLRQTQISQGQWLWEGCYLLLPYRRQKKPYDRSQEMAARSSIPMPKPRMPKTESPARCRTGDDEQTPRNIFSGLQDAKKLLPERAVSRQRQQDQQDNDICL